MISKEMIVKYSGICDWCGNPIDEKELANVDYISIDIHSKILANVISADICKKCSVEVLGVIKANKARNDAQTQF